MKNSKIFLIILAGAVVLSLILGIWQTKIQAGKKVKIVTEKKEYEQEEVLKIKILNNLGRAVCFSSCYPYYLEKRVEGTRNTEEGDEAWMIYNYQKCPEPNLVENCIDKKKVKAFELLKPDLSLLEAGVHRLILPACIGCQQGKSFKENKIFYSNEFIIK